MHQIESIDNNIIKLKDTVRFYKNPATSTTNIKKVVPIENITLSNCLIKIPGTGNAGGIALGYALNVNCFNIQTDNTKAPAISLDTCFNIKIDKVVILPPSELTSGKGYGVLIDHGCSNFTISNVIGYHTRHLIDCSSCFDGFITKCIGYDCEQVCYSLSHNSFSSDLIFTQCKVLGCS